MAKLVDRTGEKHGSLTIIRRIVIENRTTPLYEVKCECGKIKKLTYNEIKKKTSGTCGRDCKLQSNKEKKNIKMCEDYKKGIPVEELAKRYGVSNKYVYLVASKMKVKREKKAIIRPNNMKHIGEVFDNLTIIGRAEKKRDTKPYYECKCKCGNIKIYDYYTLRHRKTKTCGKDCKLIEKEK